MTRTISIIILSLFVVSLAGIQSSYAIDPALNSTYIGGTGQEKSAAMAFDSNNNVFIVGSTKSPAFLDGAITGFNNTPIGDVDVIVVKLTNDLSTILAATYLGTAGEDSYPEIAIDSNDNVFVSGETFSAGFPGVSGGAQSTYSDLGDLFVVKLDNDLGSIQQATYFGHASGYDENYSIHIDPVDDEIFVVGMTNSTTLPSIAGGMQTVQLGGHYEDWSPDGMPYIVKFSNDLTIIEQSTFYGGSSDDSNPSLQISATGQIFLEGNTNGTSWLTNTAGGYQENFNGIPTDFSTGGLKDNAMNTDLFVSIIDNDLTTVQQSTYLGGAALDAWADIFIHTDGNLYFNSETYSTDFPTTAGVIYENHGLSCNLAGDTKDGSGNPCTGFAGAEDRSTVVAVMTPDLTTLVRSTYIGIPYPNDPAHLAVDQDGDVYVTGQKTAEQEYSFLEGAIQTIHGGGSADAYVIKLNNAMTEWIQTTFIGGLKYENNPQVYFDNTNQLFLSTKTNSLDYPGVENGAQSTKGGNYDLVFSRIANDLLTLIPVVIEEEEEKKGGGCSGDCTPPTFYKNKSNRLIVENGFSFNGNSTDVVDYHVPWDLITVDTNYPYIFSMKAYENLGPANFKWIQIGFGVPEIGSPLNDAEVLLEVQMHGDTIRDSNVIDNDNLVEFSDMIVQFVPCGYVDSDCLEFSGLIVFREELRNNVIAINAVDNSRNSATHYINDGIIVQGTSMNPPKQQQIPSEIKYNGLQTIQRIDKINDIWITLDKQEPVLYYQQNSFGTFIPVERRTFEPTQDENSYVMTRMHSEFNEIKLYEQRRGAIIFDSELIQGTVGPSYEMQYADSVGIPRMDKLTELMDSEKKRAQVVFSENYVVD